MRIDGVSGSVRSQNIQAAMALKHAAKPSAESKPSLASIEKNYQVAEENSKEWSPKLFGFIPLGVIIGVIAIIIGVLCLVRDFDAVKVGVNTGVPVKYSWLCTFAIMTDVIWIYLEILKLLSYFMRRD